MSRPGPVAHLRSALQKGWERTVTYGSLVTFSHTVFALPFAASAVVLARAEVHTPITARRLCAMLVCMFTARTSAMAFNRWADRDVDAQNPRTLSRHVPSGRVHPHEALALSLGSGGLFVASASTLGSTAALLALPVLAILLGYSYAKRFTFAAHAWLGLALALAPGGAWIAMGAAPNLGIVALMVAVLTWLLGFDTLYSLQDERFDREARLHSIPARFGTRVALNVSRAAHGVTVLALFAVGLLLHRGGVYFAGAFATAALLAYEHTLVRGGALDKIDKAFFDVNAWVSVGFFGITLADDLVRRI